jgi:hypothetical protein
MIQLGSKVKDKITGFTGIATGYCSYISGCNQVLINPPVSADGNFQDSHWFDEQRLERVDVSIITLDNGNNPGADKAAPKR